MLKNPQQKQIEFNKAMELYENNSFYSKAGKLTSFVNISLEFVLLFIAFLTPVNLITQFISIIIAFIIADFINGFVHLYMDNNENYTNFAGPFVAAFHLHHKTPVYRRRNFVLVFYEESGSKTWLVFFLIASILFSAFFNLNPVITYILAYVAFFSSLAELTHYYCHIPNVKGAVILRKLGLFLSKTHHAKHHLNDNLNYAFLNGITDPIINIIAKTFFKGYKNNTDKHYETYIGKGTQNRE